MFFTTSPDALFISPKTIDPIGFGKVAIVTGCSSGIGLACTQLLLAHQYMVCGLDVRAFDYSLLQESDHGRFHFHRADLTELRACEDGVYASIASFGIDLLVNVAGVMDNFSSADGVSDAEWDRVMAVNLTVPVKMMRAVLPFMKEKNTGVIVNVASTAGTSGAVAGIAYTCSKHGLIGATKNVAWRFRKEGIRCNAILPGAINSRIGKTIASGQVNEFDLEAYAQVEPIHALHAQTSESSPNITPLEVAHAVVYLASDQARTISGVSLPIDRAWNSV
ncbi:bacilysin biosynthesis oxidoreductase bacC [Colletotrichum karsti]|uniref:Bacilysin biosynthesis oxidoreductase bacC n=1 Tax=Colletotrichum karsti TaxID=1095194 RepID=A0A9P6LJG0_9PEZI|nr:bacilysin biosynthesis oxidoreductase bacC [Colletotrichum karsti]KAF9875638.1 bacilysin biosynthesis oxidoreductase bacC [Colletotrichum karsti]